MSISPRASITAVHGYLPPDVLTNAELARMVDTSDAWIREKSRRTRFWVWDFVSMISVSSTS